MFIDGSCVEICFKSLIPVSCDLMWKTLILLTETNVIWKLSINGMIVTVNMFRSETALFHLFETCIQPSNTNKSKYFRFKLMNTLMK